jgi:hypothetical protein
MKGECPNNNTDCPYYETGCFSDTHHQMWPSDQFITPVERLFRELPENKEQLCRLEHDEIHATQEPPAKPRRTEMIQAIGEAGIYLSVRARKALYGRAS